MKNLEKETPMMRQYYQIKSEHPDKIIFFRMGDFYEMFGDDAVKAAKVLQIQLTARNKNQENPIPMCGIPFHASENYLNKLSKARLKVAICEQVEEPGQGKKILKREIVRIVTPGTVLSPDLIESNENSYISAIYPDLKSKKLGLAFCDLSTGEFETETFSIKSEISRVQEFILNYRPREVLLPDLKSSSAVSWITKFFDGLNLSVQNDIGLSKEFLDIYQFDFEKNKKLLEEHFNSVSLDGCDIDQEISTIIAAGSLLSYLKDTQRDNLKHIISLKRIRQHRFMVLDDSTISNLEVFRSNLEGNEKNSLVGVLDNTKTPMGARLLRKWIKQPLIELNEINERLRAVEEATHNFLQIEVFQNQIRGIGDVDRIISRISLPIVGVQDFVRLRESVKHFGEVDKLSSYLKSARFTDLLRKFDSLTDLSDLIDKYLSDSPSLKIKEGGYIKEGLNERLDKLRDLTKNAKSHIASLEAKERQNTGISGLKVKYNKVFGYYIEVSNAAKGEIPEHYIRRQTLVNGERYITEELKDLEESIISAESESQLLEQDLFQELIKKVLAEIVRIKKSSEIIAELDALFSFSSISVENNFSKPVFLSSDSKRKSTISNGRHPVIEKIQSEELFISNDLELNEESQRVLLITGPNMGGKSTYMRQVALISLMAQIGCFVPAESAELPIYDRIFTRVGAADNLSKGQSTFMLEMNEAAVILNNATERSLVILDEVGRGTSTYDGISIAWAIVEHLHEIGSFTLFATHYHELTTLEEQLKALVNFNVLVLEEEEKIIFLKKIEKGKADRSYGIHVARLAGLPNEVIKKANSILNELENESRGIKGLNKEEHQIIKESNSTYKRQQEDMLQRGGQQISFFEPDLSLKHEIESFDLLNSSPIESMQFISKLQKKLSSI